MKSVQVGDLQVAYDVQGEGEPLILLHGSCGSSAHWALVAPALVDACKLILVDYAGGGETPDPGHPLEIDELVDEVLAVADAEGLDSFHVAGWSLGGAIALATAARVPERVRSLVGVNTWARSDAYVRFEMDLWQRLLATDTELFYRYALQIGFTHGWFDVMGEGVEAMLAMGVGTLAPGSARHAELDGRLDIADRIPAITAPTLILGGLHDQIVPFTHSPQLVEQIPDARLVELPCGHMSVFECAEQLATELRAFVLEHAGAADSPSGGER